MADRRFGMHFGGIVVAVALAVVLVPAGARLTTRPSGTGCVGEVRLPVITSVDKIAIIRGMAARFSGPHGRAVAGRRVCLDVLEPETGSITLKLTEAARKLAVSDQEYSGRFDFPAVWIPASTVWWAQLKERTDHCAPDKTIFSCPAAGNGLGMTPQPPPSLASSPLVIAVPHFLKAKIDSWRDGQTSWAELTRLGDPAIGDPLVVLGKSNPNVSTIGLGSELSMLWEAAGNTQGRTPETVLSTAIFGLDKGRTPAERALAEDAQQTTRTMESVFAHYDRTTISLLCDLPEKVVGAPRSQVQVIPLEEQTVWLYNTGGRAAVGCPGAKEGDRPNRDDRLEALFIQGRSLMSDHPFVLLDPARDKRSVKVKAAEEFRAYLTSAERRKEFQGFGFREPDPKAPDDRRSVVLGSKQVADLYGDDPVYPNTLKARDLQPPPCITPKPACPRGLFDRALGLWATKLRKPLRATVLLDISGSMGSPTNGTGATKINLATTAIDGMLTAFHQGDRFGLRAFSSGLDGDRDYKDIHPLGPVSYGTQRQVHGKLERFLTGPLDDRPWVRGGTGLYDSVEASVRDMATGCRPGEIGSLTVLTDGGNSDAGGQAEAAKLGRLLRYLESSARGKCPVRVMLVAYGSDVGAGDARAMKQIADATRGRVYYATDPASLSTVLTDIIGDF